MRWVLLILTIPIACGAGFRAGVATVGNTQALAIEDPQHHRAVIVTTGPSALTQVITDVVAARVQEDYDLDRAHLLFHCSGTSESPGILLSGLGAADALVEAVGLSLRQLQPALITYTSLEHDDPAIAVQSSDGHPLAVLSANASAMGAAISARQLPGPLRAAFINIDLEFALQTRERVRRTLYPIQALRFGNTLTILVLGGEILPSYAERVRREFGPGKLLVIAGVPSPPAERFEERIFAGIHQVLTRVGIRQLH